MLGLGREPLNQTLTQYQVISIPTEEQTCIWQEDPKEAKAIIEKSSTEIR